MTFVPQVNRVSRKSPKAWHVVHSSRLRRGWCVSKACRKSRSRPTRSTRNVRLSWKSWHLRLFRNWSGLKKGPWHLTLDTNHRNRSSKGRHLIALGAQPGPLMGALLQQVYERQLDGTISSLDEAVHEAKELLLTVHKKTGK